MSDEENTPGNEENTPIDERVAEAASSSGDPSHEPEHAEAAKANESEGEEASTSGDDAEESKGIADDSEATPPKKGSASKSAPKRSRKSSKAAEHGDASDSGSHPVKTGSADGAEGSSEQSKRWYVVKVQSGREDSIKAAIERKVKIEGLEDFFGQIAIPVEEIVQKKSVRVTDKKTGDKVTQEKKVVKYQKKFPGYIFAEVEFNDRILYLFRETSGVGDFVGASLKRDPTPMTEREVRAMFTGMVEGDIGSGQKQKVKLDYEKGDKVKIRDGAFANMEGVVKSISDNKDSGETPKVEVVVTIFGRPVEVILDYWHVDKA